MFSWWSGRWSHTLLQWEERLCQGCTARSETLVSFGSLHTVQIRGRSFQPADRTMMMMMTAWLTPPRGRLAAQRCREGNGFAVRCDGTEMEEKWGRYEHRQTSETKWGGSAESEREKKEIGGSFRSIPSGRRGATEKTQQLNRYFSSCVSKITTSLTLINHLSFCLVKLIFGPLRVKVSHGMQTVAID